jgi:cytoskeletal protein RodZ
MMNLGYRLFLFVCAVGMSQVVWAADSVGNSAQAAKHGSASVANSAMSVGHAAVASGQATSAASAVPLSIGAAVGAASGQAAHQSMRAAVGQIGKPLPITDETVTIISPDEALKAKQETAKPADKNGDKKNDKAL